jgi:hypothetical protein
MEAGKSSSHQREKQQKMFPMIRGIFWNVRAMNKKGMGPYIRKLMVESRFDFICIQ